METTNIYILIDPRTNQVRYVGKANNISQRYRAHLNRARKHQIHKKNWIESLKREGLKPIIEIIDVVPINDWIYWETYWIGQFKAWGFDLINYTNGGDGCTFGNQTSFKKGDKAKKIVGYTNDFFKKYEFDSGEDASRFFKTNRSSITGSCHGRNKTIKNLAWFYFDDIKLLSEIELKKKITERFTKTKTINSGNFVKGQKSIRAKRIIVEDITTGDKNVFESGEAFGITIGMSQSSVSWSIKYKTLLKKKYKINFYE